MAKSVAVGIYIPAQQPLTQRSSHVSGFFVKVFIHLFLAVSGLSCRAWDLALWHAGFSLVVTCGLVSCPACRILFPNQESNPRPQGSNPVLEGRFLITGLPEKSLDY